MIEVGLFVLGIILAVVWFSVIALPVLYGFPRALYWALRGWARWRGAFAYLVAPLVWTIIFLGGAFAVTIFSPNAAHYLLRSGGFGVGQELGVIVCVGRAIFSKSTRLGMADDFLNFIRPYLTPQGIAKTPPKPVP